MKEHSINKNEQFPAIEVKINEGITSVEEKLENNNSHSNPYDLPDDF